MTTKKIITTIALGITVFFNTDTNEGFIYTNKGACDGLYVYSVKENTTRMIYCCADEDGCIDRETYDETKKRISEKWDAKGLPDIRATISPVATKKRR